MNQQYDPNRYVNDVEVARILSASPQTLRNWRFLGRGPVYAKKTRMVRYRVQDLLDFMEAGRIDPEARQGGDSMVTLTTTLEPASASAQDRGGAGGGCMAAALALDKISLAVTALEMRHDPR